ncbi:hypothetical protein AB0I81_50205 [Nonomuraea sp. NPDC050404]|uniref:hypothetical protein n=1 Tax=Nonomuraea sp. NPDC050404 TaxID=3155783 RepID=UPI0033C2FA13
MFCRRVALGIAGLLTAVLSTGTVAMPTMSAHAGGKTKKTYGCYAKWWETAFAGYCDPATRDQDVRLEANCSLENDYSGRWFSVYKGSYHEPFDSSDCTFPVNGAWLGIRAK